MKKLYVCIVCLVFSTPGSVQG